MSRTERLVYIALTLLGMVFVLVYKGPGWPFVRGHVGDWLIVQWMYLIARFWIGFRWRYALVGAILLIAVLVEVIKFFANGSIPNTFFAEMTLGSVFDPLDMIAFVLGLVSVLVVDQLLSRRYSTAG